MSDNDIRMDDLYDKWEAEYQKRAALIQALETLCAAWAQANREVAQMVNADNIAAILTTEQSMNAIAHMTERRKCESALENILKAHN